MEIELRELGQLGLEDIDSAKKSLTSLILYRNIINNYVDIITKRMLYFGYSQESVNKLIERIDNEDEKSEKQTT